MSCYNKSVLITGGASGIGQELTLQLASRRCKLTVVDLDGEGAEALAAKVRAAGGQAQAFCCDVCNTAQQQAAFDQHLKTFHSLDVAILNAGIGESGNIFEDTDTRWQKALDVDLTAVLVGAQLAVQAMAKTQTRGVIMVTASAGGLFPMPPAPIYAAAKAGVVHFVRSVGGRLWDRYRIRISAFCPQFVDTKMVEQMRQTHPEGSEELIGRLPLLTTAHACRGAMRLLDDDDARGTILLALQDGSFAEWLPPRKNLRPLLSPPRATGRGAGGDDASGSRDSGPEAAAGPLPTHARQIQVVRLSNDFDEATRIVSQPLPPSLPKGHVLMKRLFMGINASDVNFTAGRYFGDPKTAAKKLPFNAGFEAVGVVAALAPDVTGFRVGDAVASMTYGGFADYAVVPAKLALPLPSPDPQMVALLTSGLTASIGLEVAGRMGSLETVLVTAAAGGTGQFAVQLAAAAGNTVIATCGSRDKADLLRRLGASRVVNYREESLKAVLKGEFPKGVNLVYESVGGEMFETCLNALAPKGRLVVIGMMSAYGAGWPQSELKGLPEKLLYKSATLAGFFLTDHANLFKPHLQRLTVALHAGKLTVALDPTPFRGLQEVSAAVKHLQSGQSVGKVVVSLVEDQATAAPRL